MIVMTTTTTMMIVVVVKIMIMMMPLLVHGGGGCDDYDAFVRGWWVLINKTITIKMKASRTITISIVTCP